MLYFEANFELKTGYLDETKTLLNSNYTGLTSQNNNVCIVHALWKGTIALFESK